MLVNPFFKAACELTIQTTFLNFEPAEFDMHVVYIRPSFASKGKTSCFALSQLQFSEIFRDLSLQHLTISLGRSLDVIKLESAGPVWSVVMLKTLNTFL